MFGAQSLRSGHVSGARNEPVHHDTAVNLASRPHGWRRTCTVSLPCEAGVCRSAASMRPGRACAREAGALDSAARRRTSGDPEVGSRREAPCAGQLLFLDARGYWRGPYSRASLDLGEGFGTPSTKDA